MRNSPHKTLIGILRDAIEVWRKRERLSQAAVVECIVEAHEKLGLDVVTEIRFESDRDAHRRMETNRERVYRWLDDISKQNNQMPANFVQSVIAALPMDLRLAVADQLLFPAGLSAKPLDCDDAAVNVAVVLAHVAKESGEATASLAALVDGATVGELRDSQREITEAMAALEEGQRLVEGMLAKAGGAA